MRTTPVNDHLIQLTRLGFVNAYLVREDDGFTLVDTMLKGSGKAIREAAGDVPIVRILLTHGHGDHVGSADELDAIPAHLHEADAQILAGVAPKTKGSWPKVTRSFEPLRPGDRIGSLEVIENPGHTRGHVAFLDTRDRTVLCGDTYTTTGGVAIPNRLGQRFPLAAMATDDKARIVESARALRALEPALLAAGHGKVVRDPLAAMDRAIAKA